MLYVYLYILSVILGFFIAVANYIPYDDPKKRNEECKVTLFIIFILLPAIVLGTVWASRGIITIMQ